MKVKKYVVDSMPDALQKIRTELGKDAVIINTKEIRVGGILGMFSKKKIEVIAATDAAPEATKPPPAHAQREGGSAAAYGSGASVRSSGAAEQVTQTSVATLSFPPRPAQPIQPVMPSKSAFPLTEREDALLEEMKQMKEMMRRLAGGQPIQEADPARPIPPALLELKERLLQQEIRLELAQELIEAAAMEALSSDVTAAEAHQLMRDQLLSMLRRRPVERLNPDTRIVHFVGPTGVGKTTTIAKLAAEQVLKNKRSVGFITSDTYRIAAVEQLKTYANILNVPIEVVFSPLDLPKAFEKLSGCDIIFMDTAGRNFRNEMYVSELNSLLKTEERHETYIVLSLSMKYNDMRAITSNFSKFGLHKVLFTKADETLTFGSVINLLHDFPLSLSYITDGQNVPDDIRLVDEEKLADLVLEEPQHE